MRQHRYGEIEENNLLESSHGLAWTELGGDLLSIEAVTLPGKGKFLTGQLGDVMKESIDRGTKCSLNRGRQLLWD